MKKLLSKRMRSMDQSFDEYHSANDESFNNVTSNSVNSFNHTNTTVAATTLARQQLETSAVIDEPKKPLSAYALFFRDTVSAIKQQNPTCTFQELSRIVSSMWEALDPTHKNVYQKKHEMARNDYINQMRTYRQQIEQQQQLLQEQEELSANDSSNNTSFQTKPAVFTITRFNADNNVVVSSASGTLNNINASTITTTAQQQHEQIIVNNVQQQPMKNTENNLISNTTTSNSTQSPAAPQQIEMLTEAGSAQKCTRENCTKRAIINPDWEDEYCSNECVVIHCRTVFNDWVKTNLDARKQ